MYAQKNNSRMSRHSCCEVRVMQLHDILLLRTSASLHSVSVGAKPLSTGQYAPCRKILCNKKCNFLYTQKKWLVHTNHFLYKYIPSKLHIRNVLTSYLSTLLGYALDLLVTVSSMCYHTSTSVLSTSSSSRGLTTFVGISHLEGGFTLRCLQRLSRPGLATLLCSWQNNRSTSGQSIPVLSY